MNLFTTPNYADERKIIELALQHGWAGNLYHSYLIYSLLMDENPLSLLAERRELPSSSLYQLGLLNVQELIEDLAKLPKNAETACLENFESDIHPTALGKWIGDHLCDFDKSQCAKQLFDDVLVWYKTHGCGIIGSGSVFSLEGNKEHLRLIPVPNPHVSFESLIGYEEQKAELCSNTEAFLQGGFANNVLLYGDAGTGKSTSILSLAERYGNRGLKIIQIHKAQTELLPSLFELLRHRNQYFILAMDDLSFEQDEREYKELKSALEGDVASLPDNALVYATSNRRHLVKETWNDRNDMEHQGDVHRSETMEEKLSLSARFGLRIFYPSPSFKEYQAIVKQLAGTNPVAASLSQEELAKLAGKWQISAGSTSGRTAKQFINSLQ